MKHAVVQAGRLAEEMWHVAEIGFDSEDAVSAPDRDAKVGPLLLTIRHALTVCRVAAEIEPDVGRHEPVRPCRGCRHRNDYGRQRTDHKPPHWRILPSSLAGC